jgi:hypothetical protein
MLNAGTVDYLNVKIGDNVSLALDFTSLTGGTQSTDPNSNTI